MGRQLTTQAASPTVGLRTLTISSALAEKIALGRALREVQTPSPDEARALPALIREADALMTGSTAEQVVAVLATYAFAFPDTGKKLTGPEKAARRTLYVEGLSDIPADVLEQAMKDAVKSCEFFPTVKTIRELAEVHLRERRYHAFVLRRMKERADEAEAARKREAELMPPDIARAKLAELAASIGTRTGDAKAAA